MNNFEAYKMDGLGNDFIIFDQRERPISLSKDQIIKISNRNNVGCDQVILIGKDKNNNPFLNNPFIWDVENSKTPIMWLYFNYYGKHLMFIQSSDNTYYDYLSGDPGGYNQYLLPDSNIEGGYGLFSSNYSIPFFIDAKKGIDIKDDW